MKEKSTRIVIEFKEPSGQTNVLKNKGSKPNLLVIEMSPDQSMTLQLNASDPENKGEFKPVHIDLSPDKGDLAEAYENLIRDALLGDPTFFAHWDEVELSWAWVQPILDAFQKISCHFTCILRVVMDRLNQMLCLKKMVTTGGLMSRRIRSL